MQQGHGSSSSSSSAQDPIQIFNAQLITHAKGLYAEFFLARDSWIFSPQQIFNLFSYADAIYFAITICDMVRLVAEVYPRRVVDIIGTSRHFRWLNGAEMIESPKHLQYWNFIVFLLREILFADTQTGVDAEESLDVIIHFLADIHKREKSRMVNAYVYKQRVLRNLIGYFVPILNDKALRSSHRKVKRRHADRLMEPIKPDRRRAIEDIVWIQNGASDPESSESQDAFLTDLRLLAGADGDFPPSRAEHVIIKNAVDMYSIFWFMRDSWIVDQIQWTQEVFVKKTRDKYAEMYHALFTTPWNPEYGAKRLRRGMSSDNDMIWSFITILLHTVLKSIIMDDRNAMRIRHMLRNVEKDIYMTG